MVYKFRCVGCREILQVEQVRVVFNEGCSLCGCKAIRVKGYVKEVNE